MISKKKRNIKNGIMGKFLKMMTARVRIHERNQTSFFRTVCRLRNANHNQKLMTVGKVEASHRYFVMV